MSTPRHPGFGSSQRIINMFWTFVGALLVAEVLGKLKTHQPVSGWGWARLVIGSLVFLVAAIAVVQDLWAQSRSEKS